MTNPYIKYYVDQAGSGLAGFEGYQYQRGHGFFSSIFQNIIKPLGRYLGRQVLSTGVNVGQDLLQGENLKDSLKKQGKVSSKNMLVDSIARAQKFAQTGTGRKRRRRSKTKKTVKKAPIKKRGKKKNKSVRKKKSTKKRSKKPSKFSHLF